MGLATALRSLLQEPRLKGIQPTDAEVLSRHCKILSEKKMMREVFEDFYRLCRTIDERVFVGDGKRVELGAGSSFFKDLYPDVISSDIQQQPHLDMMVDAEAMPFAPRTVRAIYGINCFHHFLNPRLFFNELMRVLVPGGGCILIEPHYGLVAKHFYKVVHVGIETFDAQQTEWASRLPGDGEGTNQAMSYVVFTKGLEQFEKEYPDLELLLDRPLGNYLRYLLSGGLNFRQLVPDAFSSVVRFAEFLLTPLHPLLALHHVIVVRKKTS